MACAAGPGADLHVDRVRPPAAARSGVYFFHRGELRLLALEPLMNRLGIGHQLPSLLAAVGVILGGRFVLPEGRW